MKITKTLSTIASLFAAAYILSACTVRQSEQPPGTLALTIRPASEVHIVQASARQEGEEVIVDGQVKRRKTGGRGIVKGHIDIDIFDEKAQAIRQVVTDCLPNIIPRFNGMKSSFSKRIPMMASQAILVRIQFHNGPHHR